MPKPPSFSQPAPGQPVKVSFPTPRVEDFVLVEVVQITPGYKVPAYGTPHPKRELYPNHTLSLVIPSEDGQSARHLYAAGRLEEDTYNYAIKFTANSAAHKVYVRTYFEKRAEYERLANGSPDPLDTAAVLTSEDMLEVEQPELRSLYVRAVRVFEVLPGPYVPYTRFDDNLGPVQGRRRAVVNTGQTASLTATAKTTYEGRDGSSYVSLEIEEGWSDGTGTDGNPVYPILTTDTFDPDRGPVQIVSQIVVATGSEVGSSSVSGSTVTKITYEAFNQFLLKKIVETWTIPFVTTAKKTNAQKQVVSVTNTRENETTTPTTPSATTDVTFTKVGDGTALEVVETVPEVFDDSLHAKERPDTTPEKFRALLTTTDEDTTVAGTAAAPTLATGDISASEQQVTKFTKRTRRKNRTAVSLPVAITGKETNSNKQVVSVTETLEADSTTPAVPSATQDVTFEKLGDGTAVETVKSIPAVFDEGTFSKDVPDVVPEKFRVALPIAETSIVAAGTAAAPSLASGDLSVSQQQVTAFTKRTRIRTRAAVSKPVSLVGHDTNQAKQDVTVTETYRVAGSNTAPSALVDVTVQNLGDGNVVETTKEIAEVFADTVLAAERPDTTPAKFRALVPVTTEEETVAGTAAAPTLGTGDLEASEQQTTEFTKRTRVRNRDVTSLPVTIVSKKTNAKKQVVTVTEILEVDSATPAVPSATQDVTFEKLGDGTAVETKEAVPSVFGADVYRSEIPAAPSEFRTGTSTHAVESAGSASAPTASGDNIQKESQQVDAFTKRDTTTTQVKVTSRTGKRTNAKKQEVAVVRTLGSSGGSPSATVDVTDEFVDGQLVGETTTVPEVFGDAEFRAQDAAYPSEYVTREDTTASNSEGTAEAPDFPPGGNARQQQVDAFVVRTEVTTPTVGETLSEVETNSKKQRVSVTRVLNGDAGDPSATVDVAQRTLAGGRTESITKTVDAVFAAEVFRSEIPAAPSEFRTGSSTHEIESAGDASAPSASGDNIAKTSTQVDAFTKRDTTTTQTKVTSRTEKRTNAKGQLVTVTKTLGSSGGSNSATAEVTDRYVDGQLVGESAAVSAVFDEQEYTAQDAPYPSEYVTGETVVSTVSAGTAASPTAPIGGRATQQNATAFTKRVSTTTPTLSKTVTEYETNRHKQKVTVVKVADGTVGSNSATVEVEQHTLPGGRSEAITKTAPAVFGENVYRSEIPAAPSEFRTGTSTTAVASAGTASAPTASGDNIQKTEEQVDAFTKKVTTTAQTKVTTLTEKRTNEYKQLETVTKTLGSSGGTPSATVDVTDRYVDGQLVGEAAEVDEVFDRQQYSADKPDVTPEWAKALLTTTTERSIAAGDTVEAPTLGTGELRKTVARVTAHTTSTETVARDAAELPKSRTNKQLVTEFGGGLADQVETIDTGTQVPSSGGLLVLSSEMKVLGDGTSVLSTLTAEDAAWPVLDDYDIDEETGQTIHTTYQVVAASAGATATRSSGVVTKYKHIDKWRSMKIVSTYSTPASYDEQRFGAHSFPTLFSGTYIYSDACGSFLGLRGGFSASVRMKSTITYTSSRQTYDGLTLIPGTLHLGRAGVISDALFDAGTFVFTGECSATMSWTATSPSYTGYLALVGTEQLVAGESVRTNKGGLYRNTQVYVNML